MSRNYLLNQVPWKKEGKTPYELWKDRRSSYKYLRVWGYFAKVAFATQKKMKMGPQMVDCIFIDYTYNSNAYKFLVYESKNSDIHKNTIMECRNASFFEHVFPCKSKERLSSSKWTHETMNEESHDLEDEQGVQTKPRRSKRTRVEKSFGPKFLTYLLENEPQNYEKTTSSLERPLWKKTIKNEVGSIL